MKIVSRKNDVVKDILTKLEGATLTPTEYHQVLEAARDRVFGPQFGKVLDGAAPITASTIHGHTITAASLDGFSPGKMGQVKIPLKRMSNGKLTVTVGTSVTPNLTKHTEQLQKDFREVLNVAWERKQKEDARLAKMISDVIDAKWQMQSKDEDSN